MEKRDDGQTIQEFGRRQSRQLFAIAIALLLLVFLVLVHKRPDLFGEVPKRDIAVGQLITIAAFIGFSSWNWRCPSCKHYLGKHIIKDRCRHCGARLR